MDTLTIISNLSQTNSRLAKEQIIHDAFMAGNREFFVGCRLAYDNLITFGVAKVALIEEEDDSPGTLTFQDFLALTRRLRARELTGHAARDAINAAADSCNVAMWNNFYRRILLKDMKSGFEAKTVNKILQKIKNSDAADYVIPVFECQLAKDGGSDDHADKITGVKMIDDKYDGVRLLTVLDKESKTVTQFTRNGKLNENFPHIVKGLTDLLVEIPASIVLDGEIIGTNFQELMTQVNRKDDVDSKTARLALFDIIPLKDFRAGYCAITQKKRHSTLSELQTSGLFQKHCGNSVYVVPKVTVDLRTSEGQKTFAELNKNALLAEKEGIMIKDPDAPYEGKRTASWLKLKPFIDVSLEVIAVEEGKSDGKYVGMLGALVCAGTDDGKYIETNVGSGITDAQRIEWWNDPNKVLGMIAEVRADGLTKARDTNDWSLRFPRFKGWRGSEPGEKI